MWHEMGFGSLHVGNPKSGETAVREPHALTLDHKTSASCSISASASSRSRVRSARSSPAWASTPSHPPHQLQWRGLRTLRPQSSDPLPHTEGPHKNERQTKTYKAKNAESENNRVGLYKKQNPRKKGNPNWKPMNETYTNRSDICRLSDMCKKQKTGRRKQKAAGPFGRKK